eukprot:6375404-Prymnesium_polylepis.2
MQNARPPQPLHLLYHMIAEAMHLWERLKRGEHISKQRGKLLHLYLEASNQVIAECRLSAEERVELGEE